MTRRAPPAAEPPAAGTVRYRMVVAYDGAPFRGFADNPGVPTVAGTLADAMGRVLGAAPSLTCAGRTDAGVHGWGQVVSFDAPALDEADLQKALNGLCGPEIVVRALERAEPTFDARFSARSRTYRYRVLNRAVGDPFLRDRTWHVREPLDVSAMNRAGARLVGEHDFSSFCRKRLVTVDGRTVEAPLRRQVLELQWHPTAPQWPDDPAADVVELWITATSFCHQMVRAITGTLVDVGRGRIAVEAIDAILAARNRAAAGPLAPAHGLTLWQVEY